MFHFALRAEHRQYVGRYEPTSNSSNSLTDIPVRLINVKSVHSIGTLQFKGDLPAVDHERHRALECRPGRDRRPTNAGHVR